MWKKYLFILLMNLFGLLLFVMPKQSMAQTYNEITWDGSAEIAATTFSTNTRITLTGNVTLKGCITISGGEVIFQTDGVADRMIKRKYASGNTFTMFDVTGGTLRMDGNGKTLTVDGAAIFATAFDASTSMTNSSYYNGNMFYIKNAHMYATDCIFQNGYNSDGPGAIRIGTTNSTNYDFKLTNVIIRAFRGRMGPAVFFGYSGSGYGDTHRAEFDNLEVYGCRSTGNSDNSGITNDAGTT